PPPEEFTKGFGTDLILGFREYLPISTSVTMYMGTIIQAIGTVYRNEYGIIVLSDGDGNTPLFIPVNNIRVVLPDYQAQKALSTDSPKAVTVSVKA
ncbi:MAG TPA: hypothetical protein VHP38_11660, partial [Ruminiclostridium sp.]|nr:hypothetical protein [Ruminiclostridium sp.]